jgi:hypothetical protein
LGAFTFLSPAALDFLKRTGYEGFQIQNTEYFLTGSPWGSTPGRLRYWMPVDRGLALGGTLDIA